MEFLAELHKIQRLKEQTIFTFYVDSNGNDLISISFPDNFIRVVKALENFGIKPDWLYDYSFHASKAKIFFHCLHQLQKDNPELMISKHDSEIAFADLLMEGFLTLNEIREIKKCIRFGITIKDYEEEVLENKNISGALALSVYYSNKKQFGINSYVWLKYAQSYEGDIPYKSFFNNFEIISTPWVFELSSSILDELSNANIYDLKLLDLAFESHSSLIKGMKYFIKRSNSLKSIKLASNSDIKLGEIFIGPLTSALKKNKSVKRLYIDRAKLLDIEWMELFKAIRDNPESNIQDITIVRCNIPNEGGKVILDLMRKKENVKVNVKYSRIHRFILSELDDLNDDRM